MFLQKRLQQIVIYWSLWLVMKGFMPTKQGKVLPGKQVQHLCGNSAGQTSTGAPFLPMSWWTQPFLDKPSGRHMKNGVFHLQNKHKDNKCPHGSNHLNLFQRKLEFHCDSTQESDSSICWWRKVVFWQMGSNGHICDQLHDLGVIFGRPLVLRPPQLELLLPFVLTISQDFLSCFNPS